MRRGGHRSGAEGEARVFLLESIGEVKVRRRGQGEGRGRG